MTVRELIEELRKLPKNAEICIDVERTGVEVMEMTEEIWEGSAEKPVILLKPKTK